MKPVSAPYSIRAAVRNGYLRIEISGHRSTWQASVDGWREVGRIAREQGATRILVVSLLDGPMPTPDEQRSIMTALIGWGFEGVRTAFVLNDVVRIAELEHGEMAARELGQQTRVFGSESMAEVWLRYGEATSP